jgi:hypothetical protein
MCGVLEFIGVQTAGVDDYRAVDICNISMFIIQLKTKFNKVAQKIEYIDFI